MGSESVTVLSRGQNAAASPTGLDLTRSDQCAFLTWDANGEIDLAGYRVFRSDRADGGFKLVSGPLIMPNKFIDPSYQPVIYYAVSAVDESGNESAKSAAFRSP